MIQILLVSDQAVTRQSLKAQLETRSDLQVVGEAENGKCALEQLKTLALFPDIVIIDSDIPAIGSMEEIQYFYQQSPHLKVLVLTSLDDPQSIKQTFCPGVRGYLMKDTPIEDLAKAIRLIHKGYSQLAPGILEKLLQEVAIPKPGYSSDPSPELSPELMKLTAREQSVLRLVASGASNREIAQALCLTEGTVRNYISKILGQLNVRDRTQAAILANTFGSLSIPLN